MFDIKKLDAEVDKEVSDEIIKAAKAKLTTKKRDVLRAKAVVRNLEAEYAALLVEVSEDAAG